MADTAMSTEVMTEKMFTYGETVGYLFGLPLLGWTFLLGFFALMAFWRPGWERWTALLVWPLDYSDRTAAELARQRWFRLMVILGHVTDLPSEKLYIFGRDQLTLTVTLRSASGQALVMVPLVLRNVYHRLPVAVTDQRELRILQVLFPFSFELRDIATMDLLHNMGLKCSMEFTVAVVHDDFAAVTEPPVFFHVMTAVSDFRDPSRLVRVPVTARGLDPQTANLHRRSLWTGESEAMSLTLLFWLEMICFCLLLAGIPSPLIHWLLVEFNASDQKRLDRGLQVVIIGAVAPLVASAAGLLLFTIYRYAVKAAYLLNARDTSAALKCVAYLLAVPFLGGLGSIASGALLGAHYLMDARRPQHFLWLLAYWATLCVQLLLSGLAYQLNSATGYFAAETWNLFEPDPAKTVKVLADEAALAVQEPTVIPGRRGGGGSGGGGLAGGRKTSKSFIPPQQQPQQQQSASAPVQDDPGDTGSAYYRQIVSGEAAGKDTVSAWIKPPSQAKNKN